MEPLKDVIKKNVLHNIWTSYLTFENQNLPQVGEYLYD